MKQNLRKKALLPAVSMVLASVIALSGVTYAWFTTGTTASVTGMDVNVQTANGIQISLDASSWKTTISATDIKNAVSNASTYADRTIQFPEGEIAPVSSAGNIVNGKLQMFNGAYNDDGTLRSEAASDKNTTTEGNYVAFDLFFKSSSAQPLTLKMGDDASFVKCIDVATGDEADVGTDKAVRVAFLNLGSATTPAEARALKGTNGKAMIWEPNKYTRAPGVAGSGEQAYSGFTAPFAAVAEDALGDGQVEAVTTFDETQEGFVNLINGITKIRVYIWLEGQDVDCVNSISSADFTVNLGFTVPEVENQ